ncbi:MAG TPA: DUF3570 domain-containing protein [Woeseiaceae bacterium]|nr:DUF3570 domain-containing protein [Woeseiaceae bacterium]
MTLRRIRFIPAMVLLLVSGAGVPGVLPDDRADILYHLYDGGGVEIDGPSVLVRKQVGKNVSVVGNYYVDMVSSASIDVVTTASPYTEERTQYSVGMDYLHGDTTMTLGYTSSSESDFDAKTYNFSVSQDMFGDLTTLTLSYSLGDDVVGRSDDVAFARDNSRQQYGIGLSQILTRNLIATLNFETITDEGFLNNPYRSVRYVDPDSALGYSFEPELYPHTRTSNALGLRARYYLPYRAALQAEYRYFMDTWDIDAHTAALSYVHPKGPWTWTIKYRWHTQTGAQFFRDLFSRAGQTNFRGRDKELSPLTSQTLKLAASYEFLGDGWKFIDRGTVNFSIDRLRVDYDEFRDLTSGAPVGEETLYSLDANIYQLYFSFWY